MWPLRVLAVLAVAFLRAPPVATMVAPPAPRATLTSVGPGAARTPDATSSSGWNRVRVGFSDGPAAIFRARCVSCHGPAEANGDLRLDSHEATLRGGDSGPSVVPGAPSDSLLHQKLIGRDQPAMPPRVSLRPSEIRVIADWIAAGAAP